MNGKKKKKGRTESLGATLVSFGTVPTCAAPPPAFVRFEQMLKRIEWFPDLLKLEKALQKRRQEQTISAKEYQAGIAALIDEATKRLRAE